MSDAGVTQTPKVGRILIVCSCSWCMVLAIMRYAVILSALITPMSPMHHPALVPIPRHTLFPRPTTHIFACRPLALSASRTRNYGGWSGVADSWSICCLSHELKVSVAPQFSCRVCCMCGNGHTSLSFAAHDDKAALVYQRPVYSLCSFLAFVPPGIPYIRPQQHRYRPYHSHVCKLKYGLQYNDYKAGSCCATTQQHWTVSALLNLRTTYDK